MGQPEAVSIAPESGLFGLKRHARLTFRGGVLEATDRRGRTRSFDLADDGKGPYKFVYGAWKGEADLAVVDRLGEALVLVDQKMFRMADLGALEEAARLQLEEIEEQPPTRPDAVAIISPPFFKWATLCFTIGVAAFGLWSVTGIEPLVLGITLPAIVAVLVLGVLGRRSMISPEAFKEEWAKLQPELDEAQAIADAYLARHANPLDPDSERPPNTERKPADPPAAEADEQ